MDGCLTPGGAFFVSTIFSAAATTDGSASVVLLPLPLPLLLLPSLLPALLLLLLASNASNSADRTSDSLTAAIAALMLAIAGSAESTEGGGSENGDGYVGGGAGLVKPFVEDEDSALELGMFGVIGLEVCAVSMAR